MSFDGVVSVRKAREACAVMNKRLESETELKLNDYTKRGMSVESMQEWHTHAKSFVDIRDAYCRNIDECNALDIRILIAEMTRRRIPLLLNAKKKVINFREVLKTDLLSDKFVKNSRVQKKAWTDYWSDFFEKKDNDWDVSGIAFTLNTELCRISILNNCL